MNLIYLVIKHFKEVSRCEPLVFNFLTRSLAEYYTICLKRNIRIRIALIFPHGLENKRRHHDQPGTFNTYLGYLRTLSVEIIW